MKKLILVFAICLGVSFTLTSCKKDKKEEVKTEVTEEVKEVSKELASNTLYQCPMDCEKGKSYIKEGACPVCKMDLKAKEVDMDSDKEGHHDKDGDGHDTDGGN